MTEQHDVVVVGAGTAGGVVAARLSEDPARRVLLLEAGPDFPDEATVPPPFASTHGGLEPAGIPELDWGLWTQPTVGARSVRLPRGRLVGGSSMVNGTVAVRGAPADYDRWASSGNPAWSWERLLPYFVRLETDADFGGMPYHGDRGPVHIRRYGEDAMSPVHTAFIEGCTELGLRYDADLNAPEATVGCVGPWPQNRLGELRQGSLVTHLRAARDRPNLTVRADVTVDRLRMVGDQATGVTYVDVDGHVASVEADLTVLCAGAYLTPAVLQRSGIGPAGVLKAAGIDCRLDLPVGARLSDHANVTFRVRSARLSRSRGPVFLANCRGPASGDGQPGWQALAVPVDEDAGLAAVVINLTRQGSLGSVEITHDDPLVPPAIDHRHAAAAEDLDRFDEGWEFCRELMATAPFRAAGAADANTMITGRDAARAGVGTALHPVGTCRMGPASDATSVVDEDLGVHGTSGLMVADASVFCDNIAFNTNLTCFVVGEVAADIVRGRVGREDELQRV